MLDELSKEELLDVLREYNKYIQNANDNNRYQEGWFPVCINEFYDCDYKLILEEREQAKAEPLFIPDDAFEYGSYHFIPYRTFRKGEIDKRLDGDSRPWKMDAQYAMRNMQSDFEIALSTARDNYSYERFYAASNGSMCDIFRCVENGKLYVPGENELFRYIKQQ